MWHRVFVFVLLTVLAILVHARHGGRYGLRRVRCGGGTCFRGGGRMPLGGFIPPLPNLTAPWFNGSAPKRNRTGFAESKAGWHHRRPHAGSHRI